MPAIWLSLALLATPALFWLQQTASTTLNQRLWLPQLIAPVDRHTPLYTNGTYLPPTISTDYTLPASASPLLLANTTRVAPGATLTLAAGTKLYASEFATLIVDGELNTPGTANQPIIFSTNEQHAANQLWNGLVFNSGSTGQLTHTTIEFAAPAVTCLKNSHVTSTYTRLKNTKVPIFSKAPQCL